MQLLGSMGEGEVCFGKALSFACAGYGAFGEIGMGHPHSREITRLS